MSIEKISTGQSFDREYLKGCEESLKLRDSNNDGKTTADEMIFDNSKLYIAQFGEENTEFTQRATEIARRQAEIFKKYAGEDNIFTAEEHANCINSEEWIETIGAYRSLEAEKNGTYLKERQSGQYQDSNNENDEEAGFFNKIVSFFKKIFGGAENKTSQES